MLKVLIIGGGIAGQTLARLEHHGHHPVIFGLLPDIQYANSIRISTLATFCLSGSVGSRLNEEGHEGRRWIGQS
jgi:hypothetical protein